MEALSIRRRKLRLLLRAMRRERGVTQVKLAERLGVAQSVVSKIERGERRIDFPEVEAVCEALGVSLSTLCRRLDKMPDEVEEE